MSELKLSEKFDFDTINEEAVTKLERKFYGNEKLLLTCPKPVGQQIVNATYWEEIEELYHPRCIDIQRRYEEMGLIPNPWHLIALMIMEPNFADSRSIVTQWKISSGLHCYMFIARQTLTIRDTGNITKQYYDTNDLLFSGSKL